MCEITKKGPPVAMATEGDSTILNIIVSKKKIITKSKKNHPLLLSE